MSQSRQLNIRDENIAVVVDLECIVGAVTSDKAVLSVAYIPDDRVLEVQVADSNCTVPPGNEPAAAVAVDVDVDVTATD